MNLNEYAKHEMEVAWKDALEKEEDGMQRHAMNNVMELIEIFSRQGHSGASEPYILKVFDRLVRYKPLTPLTGEEDEWGEPYDKDDTQQNLRCYSVFRKHHDNQTAYDIEGIVFQDGRGFHYTSKNSIVPVTFPYNVPDYP